MKDIVPNVFDPPAGVPVSRFPHSVSLRILFDLSIGAAFGVGAAALLFSLSWWQRAPRQYWLGENAAFTAVMVAATVLGLAAWFAVPRMWREAHARVTPWLVAAAASWIALRFAISLAPPVRSFDDPTPVLEGHAFYARLAMIFVAILAYMDWRALREERASRKVERQGETG